MVMTAKFRGQCRSCGGRIYQGDPINWSRDAGASHAKCDEIGSGHSCVRCGVDAGDQMMSASLGLSCPDCYDDLSG
jgi:hypothetical protein